MVRNRSGERNIPCQVPGCGAILPGLRELSAHLHIHSFNPDDRYAIAVLDLWLASEDVSRSALNSGSSNGYISPPRPLWSRDEYALRPIRSPAPRRRKREYISFYVMTVANQALCRRLFICTVQMLLSWMFE